MNHKKLDDIPFIDLKELAMKRALQDTSGGNINKSLFGAFTWAATTEGGSYWESVNRILMKDTIRRRDLKSIIR